MCVWNTHMFIGDNTEWHAKRSHKLAHMHFWQYRGGAAARLNARAAETFRWKTPHTDHYHSYSKNIVATALACRQTVGCHSRRQIRTVLRKQDDKSSMTLIPSQHRHFARAPHTANASNAGAHKVHAEIDKKSECVCVGVCGCIGTSPSIVSSLLRYMLCRNCVRQSGWKAGIFAKTLPNSKGFLMFFCSLFVVIFFRMPSQWNREQISAVLSEQHIPTYEIVWKDNILVSIQQQAVKKW